MLIEASDLYSTVKEVQEDIPTIVSSSSQDSAQPLSSIKTEIQKGAFAPISYRQLQDRYKLGICSELRGKNATESLYRIQPIAYQPSALERKYLSKKMLADKPQDCKIYSKLSQNGDSVSIIIMKSRMGKSSIEFRGNFPISLSR